MESAKVSEEDTSKDQEVALEILVDWHVRKYKQVITLIGYAGTGKTTLVSLFRKRINDMVAFATYTGKASFVLKMKLDASGAIHEDDYTGTIHSLIYRAKERPDGSIYFVPVENLNQFGLIIIDEASMVGSKIFEELLAYGVPILFVGDEGQLPPVNDIPGVDLNNADAKLEKIHRQSEGNPIIQISKDIREGKPIPFGEYSKKIWKFDASTERDRRHIEKFKRIYDPENDMFLCGFNKTRVKINAEIRKILGRVGDPVVGDRVICLKNNKNKQIYNGMIGTIEHIRRVDDFVYSLKIQFPGVEYEGRGLQKQFGAQKTLEKEAKEITIKENPIDVFDFGYCVSVHKAQGSEFKRVMVFVERFSKFWDQKKWEYTAVTRAVEALYIVENH